jgi:hypothetical protein
MWGKIIFWIAVVLALFIAAFLSSGPHKCKAGSVESLFTDCNIQ